ncbi:hypothetical protein [Pseudomonas sp. GZD-222]|uniref:hypothetical protein n=1 Tax=Pseudomonas sp. GZD-222 TaxID=3404805 RepID=UPI003BB726EE
MTFIPLHPLTDAPPQAGRALLSEDTPALGNHDKPSDTQEHFYLKLVSSYPRLVS